jgi:hypothetical protein
MTLDLDEGQAEFLRDLLEAQQERAAGHLEWLASVPAGPAVGPAPASRDASSFVCGHLAEVCGESLATRAGAMWGRSAPASTANRSNVGRRSAPTRGRLLYL